MTALRTTPLNGATLPLVVEPESAPGATPALESFVDLCRAHGDFLREQLLRRGALLLRGFGELTPGEFAEAARRFSGRELLDYVGGASPRVRLGGGVYTSTEYPGHYSLSLHNELSYTSRWPALLFFCCAVPPASGGETPLGDSRAILKAIDPEVVRRFKRGGVTYERNLSHDPASPYSWQAAFETEDARAVERHCRAAGIRFRWRGDGALRLTETRPATTVHPTTGEEVWFNQAEGFHPSALDEETYRALTASAGEDGLRLNARFGDGSPIDAAALEHVREAARRSAVPVPWRAGDLLVLDNVLTCHGRMPFTGPRKILLAMA